MGGATRGGATIMAVGDHASARAFALRFSAFGSEMDSGWRDVGRCYHNGGGRSCERTSFREVHEVRPSHPDGP